MPDQPLATSQEQVRGAAPLGATDPESASRVVREMFTSIAPRYDLLNHLLSANIDRLWWRRTARTFRSTIRRQGATVLDLCCGTGDMAFALRRQGSEARITGADFSHAMLTRAYAKSRAESPIAWIEADALHLPFEDSSFDLVTSAFGFRNLADYDAGLREMIRVLRPGGECGILDFGEPGGVVGKLYNVYFKSVLPRIGKAISGNDGAYAYLPASVRQFPSPPELIGRMGRAGYRESVWIPYTFGIAGLFRGKK